MKRIYFDNAATTPIDKRVLKAMKPFLTKYYGNPSSTHKEGRTAHNAIEKARKQCADALNCSTDEIFFTSGASESNSWIAKIRKLRVDNKSHNSIIEAVDSKKQIGFDGIPSYPLINNETGEEKPLPLTCAHLDLTQAIGKCDIDLSWNSGIFYASLSAHKFGGPKGVGILYVCKYAQKQYGLLPLIYGHQENGKRGGTENVAGIVGMGKAIELTTKEMKKNNKQIKKVVDYICNSIYGRFYYLPYKYDVEKIQSNNHIINITFQNLNAQTAVQIFDRYGIAISAGSACNSNSEEPSHVLINSAYTESEALRTIRVSIGKQNTIKEAKKFVRVLKKIIHDYDN
jgi:cysteine desulfurase